MNEPLKPPFSEREIKKLCKISYGNDFNFMLKCYNHCLDRAKRMKNKHQIKLFKREIKTINEILEGKNHAK